MAFQQLRCRRGACNVPGPVAAADRDRFLARSAWPLGSRALLQRSTRPVRRGIQSMACDECRDNSGAICFAGPTVVPRTAIAPRSWRWHWAGLLRSIAGRRRPGCWRGRWQSNRRQASIARLRVSLADRPALPRLRIDACRPRLVARPADGRRLLSIRVFADRIAAGRPRWAGARQAGHWSCPPYLRPGDAGRAIAVRAGANIPGFPCQSLPRPIQRWRPPGKRLPTRSPIHSAAAC